MPNLVRDVQGEEVITNALMTLVTQYPKLDEYPALTGNRKFLTIRRTTPATLDAVGAGQEENWAIRLVARYQNNFWKGKT